jgi:hypothetical protein
MFDYGFGGSTGAGSAKNSPPLCCAGAAGVIEANKSGYAGGGATAEIGFYSIFGASKIFPALAGGAGTDGADLGLKSSLSRLP